MLRPPGRDADTSRAALEFVPLASGSRGNSILIRGNAGTLLVDAGLDRASLLDRLDLVRQRADHIDGLLVTHRHLDHARSAATMARRHKIPLWATERCLVHQHRETITTWVRYHPGTTFDVAAYRVTAVRLAHDAPETCGFVIDDGTTRIGIATDLGTSSGGLVQQFTGLDVLFLEFNHDLELLQRGPYSEALKERVQGERGHLSNEQAATIVRQVKGPRLRRLYLAHLSEKNNTRELALEAARSAFSETELTRIELIVAEQDCPTEPWTRES
ncbi:MAG: MBL fold metallo-hydrolase [Planctomycetes bacterium]|nr:MBL fold metallo-hydrolase [Planctomycetota bacterium]MCB9917808.1 MBL fold metallo-hydrolase [Planctomycetota bacterium]